MEDDMRNYQIVLRALEWATDALALELLGKRADYYERRLGLA